MQLSTRAYEHSGFILRLILDGTRIKYEPDFQDFEVVLLNVFDAMIKAVCVVPRVETKLYSEWVGVCRNSVKYGRWHSSLKGCMLFASSKQANQIHCFTLQGGNKSKAYLKPCILKEILDEHRQKVIDLVQRESLKPQEHAKLYDKYSFLIDKQVRLKPFQEFKIAGSYLRTHGT